MAKTWSSHGPWNWFFLNLNQYTQGCSMPNFRVLASILTDNFNFLTQSVTQAMMEWDVKLHTWSEARAGLNHSELLSSAGRMAIIHISLAHFRPPSLLNLQSSTIEIVSLIAFRILNFLSFRVDNADYFVPAALIMRPGHFSVFFSFNFSPL